MKIIKYTDKYFPKNLLNLEEPVKKVYYQGDLDLLDKAYLSVVGSRAALPWVEYWLEHELIPALKGFEIGVVSGGARGVDQLAHYCALRAGLPTLAVLPSGLLNKYPKNIETLLGDSVRVGYLSEYDADEPMRKHFFYKRNRIIAALSPLTLVVQAAQRSGTMITARFAIQYGRSVVTLPSSPVDQACAGNLQLIYDGSYFVRDKEDLRSLFFKYFNSSYCGGRKEKLAAER